jgi:membrane fusion protein (multidrug efflux system)
MCVIGRNIISSRAVVLTLVLLAACGKEETERKRSAPQVVAAPAAKHEFVDQIEAVGTARANEQVTLASAVTERVEHLYFDDGQPVRRGQLLAALSQGQEQAALSRAIATEKQAKAQLERITQLSASGFATRALYEQQVATAEGARADADDARAQIGDRMIRAPFSGYASLRTVSEGAVVSSGTPLVTVSDLSRIKLDFTVPETQLRQLSVGRPIKAISAAFPDQPFIGTITSIDPVIDPASRAVLVRATLPNPGARIKPGMLMTVKVDVSSRVADAVPELAVMGEGNERFVFIVKPDGKAKRTVVKTGLRDGGFIEVTGVPAGAKVIGEGVVKVTDGMTVSLGDKGDKSRKAGKQAGSSPP